MNTNITPTRGNVVALVLHVGRANSITSNRRPGGRLSAHPQAPVRTKLMMIWCRSSERSSRMSLGDRARHRNDEGAVAMIFYVKPHSSALPYSLPQHSSPAPMRHDMGSAWAPASIDGSNVRAKCHE